MLRSHIKEFENFDPKRAFQMNNASVEIIKENKDIVAFLYIITSITYCQVPLFSLS